MDLDRRLQQLPAEIQAYSLQVVERLQDYLRENLVGVYLLGSAALGGFIPGQSDIDIQGICAQPLGQKEKEQIVALLSHPALPCPTRGCEFVLYAEETVRHPSVTTSFEVNLNSGPRMSYHVTYHPEDEPPHWFILDRAIAREYAIPIFGPAANEIFGVIPRAWSLDAILTSAHWHAENDEAGYSSILNACRAWRFALENRWSSKDAATDWARPRVPDSDLLQQALDLRAGKTEEKLDPVRTRHLLAFITESITSIRENT
ncbi:streptomycin 3''-adenylyltransferase [Dictyobacter alpinus]|uniref:Streptomycin 3''-adenylyltransferase n=1 Tax=Dictyobacter alpinus TaxID=2014873 RepID=A0A402BII2_9CHLR|nr:aminoglycoside adenylyltransferase domain-containing protein [Dictyobacter alpinus]GCE31042.1 streptomycin 3''-adenylyltransferase [Dictyobacter alpinus]